jgi:anaerobic magnesium-protoporphyrin IX monomethyl ester cyclase
MADVVLIQPLLGGYSKIIRPVAPLSLLTIAAPLVQEGFRVSIIDVNRHKDWEGRLRHELGTKPTCVGITAKTGSQITSGLEASRIVKDLSEVPVVWGGIHPTLLPEQTASHTLVDIVVLREGDLTLLELVHALRAGSSLGEVQGIWYKENGTPAATPPRPFCNLDDLPPLPYEIIEPDSGFVAHVGKGIDVDMETSRGCPMHCAFCYNHEFNLSRWRAMSAERTIERVEHAIQSLPTGSLHFVDDNFFIRLPRAREIIRAVKALDVPWEAEGIEVKQINRLTEDDLRLMKASRVRWLKCGVESGSPRILEFIKKGITVEEILEANRRLSRSGIKIIYAFMCGFPTETVEDLRMTQDLIFRLKRENPDAMTGLTNIFSPFPGTPLHEYVKELNVSFPRNLEEWGTFDWGNANLPYFSSSHRRLLEDVYFSSIFLSEPVRERVGSPLLKAAMDTYAPVARFRTKRLDFRFHIEKKLSDLVFKFI